jgi:creatinine amidohydrolase
VDKEFLPRWRESYFPGGCAHACELETSAYLYLDRDNVREELIRDGRITYNEEGSAFHWVDLFAAGPAPHTTWTSTYTETGTTGAADLATAEKGKAAVEEAAKQLARLVVEFARRPKHPRVDHHDSKPTFAMPWEQEP